MSGGAPRGAFRLGVASLVLTGGLATGCGDDAPVESARQGASAPDAGTTMDGSAAPIDSDTTTESDGTAADGSAAVDGSAAADGSAAGATSCDAPDRNLMVMLNVIRFAREGEGGRVPGLDLDGRVSTIEDPMGCFLADATSPEGTPGVDAAFTTLLPALEAVGGDAIEGLVQSAINMGELLLAVELTGVDDPYNDDCVQVRISRGTGVPSLGTDGQLLAGQTYERQVDGPESLVSGATIRDGVLEAGPLELALPLQVFDRSILFNVRQARVRIEVNPGGEWTGVMGGAVLVEEINTLADDVGELVSDVLKAVVGDSADLLPNEAGVCEALSVSLVFVARDGFFF